MKFLSWTIHWIFIALLFVNTSCVPPKFSGVSESRKDFHFNDDLALNHDGSMVAYRMFGRQGGKLYSKILLLNPTTGNFKTVADHRFLHSPSFADNSALLLYSAVCIVECEGPVGGAAIGLLDIDGNRKRDIIKNSKNDQYWAGTSKYSNVRTIIAPTSKDDPIISTENDAIFYLSGRVRLSDLSKAHNSSPRIWTEVPSERKWVFSPGDELVFFRHQSKLLPYVNNTYIIMGGTGLRGYKEDYFKGKGSTIYQFNSDGKVVSDTSAKDLGLKRRLPARDMGASTAGKGYYLMYHDELYYSVGGSARLVGRPGDYGLSGFSSISISKDGNVLGLIGASLDRRKNVLLLMGRNKEQIYRITLN